MPRVPDLARQMNLYGETTPPGCMGGMLNMFDWNNALVGSKKLLNDMEFADGPEAPRNSLDTASGGSGTSDTPKSSSAAKTDIPFGFKVSKAINPVKENAKAAEKKLQLRGPSVVARLMGLEALPEAVAAAKMVEQGPHPKAQKERLPAAQKLFKELKMKPPAQVARDQASVGPEPKARGRDSSKRVTHRGDVNVAKHAAPVKEPADAAVPSRDEHPQERQLQEFKKQFASKLASQSHDGRQKRHPDSNEPDVHVKQVLLQEKINEMQGLHSQGKKTDPKQWEATFEKLSKSKELQDFLEVLQSNKEFVLKFLQEPNSASLDKPEENAFTPPPPIEVRQGKGESDAKVKSSEKKKKGGISPSAFARRFMESRRDGKEQKEKKEKKPKSQHGTKSQTETEENTPISTPRTSTSLLPRFRSRSKSRAAEGEKNASSKTTERDSSADSARVDPYSTGNIVLLRPGSNDSTGINSPVSTLSYSPSLSRSVRESSLKTHKRLDENREYLWDHGDMTPKSEKSRFSDWDYPSPSEEIIRTAKESIRQREKHVESRFERERSKDSKDIARTIIHQARASAIESAKLDQLAAESRLTSAASSGRRLTMSRRGSENGDITAPSTDGEITPCSTGRLSTTSSRDSHGKPSSVSGSLVGSLTGPFFSPRVAQELKLPSNRSAAPVDRRPQRIEEEPPQRKIEETPQSSRKPSPESTRSGASPRSRSPTISSQASSKVLRKAIAGSVLENRMQVLVPDPHHGASPAPQLGEKGETTRSMSNSQSEEDGSVVDSPRTLTTSLSLQRCRSVPNAAVVRDTRNRGEQSHGSADAGNAGTNGISHGSREHSTSDSAVVSGTKQFADSYKRGVEAVGSLFARAKSKERNKIFVRSRSSKKPLMATAKEVPSVLPTAHHIDSRDLDANVSLKTPLLKKAEEFDTSDARSVDWHRVVSQKAGDHGREEVKRVSNSSNASFERDLSRITAERRASELPSVLAPCIQRVRVNADMAKDQCGSDSVSITTTDVLEGSGRPQLSRSPKIRSMAMDAPGNKEEEGQDTGGEKSGQPSPISVLDSPFEEDSPSPLEINTISSISSDLQELRLRLRLLKFDGHDGQRPSLEKTDDSGELEAPVVDRQMVLRETPNSAEEHQVNFAGGVDAREPLSSLTTPKSVDLAHKRALLESIDVEGFPYPADMKDDLIYVRNLLVASEFVEGAAKVFTRWHSPCQPLDPILFENLEEYYNRGSYTPQFIMVDGKIKRSRTADLQPRHRVLFDAVNEVLLRKLGPYLSARPWLKRSKPFLRPIPLGKGLVWDTWKELCDCFPSTGVDASTFLLDRDLSAEPEKKILGENVEEFGIELEKIIFDDLINDAVQSLIQITG